MGLIEQGARACLPALSWLARPKHLALIGSLTFITIMAALLGLAAWFPGYAYDFVPYLGATLQWMGVDLPTAHATAFDAMRKVAPSDIYADLAGLDAYRLRQSSDAAAFGTVLPFYSVKIGYLAFFAAAFKSGSIALWAWGASLVAGAATAIIVLWSLLRNGGTILAPVLAALMVSAGFFELLRTPSPDAIATPLLILAALLWGRKDGLAWLIPMGLAFLFRPDSIILALALLLAAPLFGQKPWTAIFAFAAMMAGSVVLERMAGHPGWWTHFWFSNVSIQPTLEGFSEPFSVLAYLKGFARGIFQSLTQSTWLAPAIITIVAALASLRLPNPPGKRELALLLALAMTIAGKFVLFPLPDNRLYFAFIIAAAVVLAPHFARTLYRPEGSSSELPG